MKKPKFLKSKSSKQWYYILLDGRQVGWINKLSDLWEAKVFPSSNQLEMESYLTLRNAKAFAVKQCEIHFAN